MAEKKGSDATLDVSTDGISYTDVGGVKDVNDSWTTGTIDSNDYDEPDWDQHVQDRRSVSLSVTCNYDEEDAGQAIIFTAVKGTAAKLYFRYRPGGDDSGTGKEVIFQGTVESLDDSSSDGSMCEISLSVTSSGAVTYQTQP